MTAVPSPSACNEARIPHMLFIAPTHNIAVIQFDQAPDSFAWFYMGVPVNHDAA